jgi:hypothetical protein
VFFCAGLQFRCQACGHQFGSSQTLALHKSVCVFRQPGFNPNTNVFPRHLPAQARQLDSEEHEKFECSRCFRKFSYKQSLNRHKWKCEGLRMLNCQWCKYETYRVDALKDHMMSKHKGMIMNMSVSPADQPQDLTNTQPST